MAFLIKFFSFLIFSIICYGGIVTYGGDYQAIDWQNVCDRTLISPSYKFSSNWTKIISKDFSTYSKGNLLLQGFVQFERGKSFSFKLNTKFL